MNTNKKHLLIALVSSVLIVILFVGGCKKEISPSDSENIKKPDLQMSSDGGTGKDKVLRQSPGLKFEVKSKTVERILPQLKGVEQIKAKLREGLVKKKTNPGITSTSEATFTAVLQGNSYFCRGIIRTFDGPRDWYLLNTQTWVFTYIGSTANQDIEFYLNKPSVPGTYGLYAENSSDLDYTNYLSLGDPFVGVTNVGGVLEFTDKIALDAVLGRLEQAYEDHQAGFFDANTSLTEDQINALAESVGFDEFLPFREFEAYFGHTSYRAAKESEILCWANNTTISASNYPDLGTGTSEEEQTVLNSSGQLIIGSTQLEIEPLSGPTGPGNYGVCYDYLEMKEDEIYNNSGSKKVIKILVHHGSGTFLSGLAVWKAKVIPFKAKSGGGWKKWASPMSAKVTGDIYDHSDCSLWGGHNFDYNATKTRYHRKFKHQLPRGGVSGLPDYAVKRGYYDGLFIVNGDYKSISFD